MVAYYSAFACLWIRSAAPLVSPGNQFSEPLPHDCSVIFLGLYTLCVNRGWKGRCLAEPQIYSGSNQSLSPHVTPSRLKVERSNPPVQISIWKGLHWCYVLACLSLLCNMMQYDYEKVGIPSWEVVLCDQLAVAFLKPCGTGLPRG